MPERQKTEKDNELAQLCTVSICPHVLRAARNRLAWRSRMTRYRA